MRLPPSAIELIDRIMRPCIQIMGTYNLRLKLIGMFGACLLIVLPISSFLIYKEFNDVSIAKAEVKGVAIARDAMSVLIQTQKLRGQLGMKLAGQNNDTSLTQTRLQLKNSLDTLEARLNSLPEFELLPEWQAISRELRLLENGKIPASAEENFIQQNILIGRILSFITLSNEKTELLFDPVAASYLLMEASMQKIPVWIEQIALLRAHGSVYLKNGSIDSAGKATLISRLDALNAAISAASDMNQALKRSGESISNEQDAALKISQKFAESVAINFLGEQLKGDQSHYFNEATLTIEQIVSMQNHLLDRLDTLLKQRVASFHFTMKIIVISLLISGCIIYFLVVCFYRNFIDSMSQLRQAVASITSGDLSTSLVNNGTDEVALTIHEVQLMQQNLSILVANVRSNSSMVSNLGQQLASGISDMSIRTEQQASSLEQTSASVDDLAETVKNNADSAESVNNLASNVRLIAESSGDTMRAAVDSMQGIQSSALKVQEIVSMIDTIAFQTDILALNAAVEASHAGEQGRGFAVVATEVRSLAQRSADAARRIRRLIDESVTRVEAGVEQIHEVNLTLADIVGGIQHLATNINAISTASAEQSNGLAQISQAIRDLDQITQSNGKMADEAQHVSSNLEQRAGDLTHSVASFKLLQGTADEAYAMVKKAVNLFKINGLPTLQRITEDADKVFADRDMYVFAFDRQGQYLAFGGNPAKLEVNLLKVNGLDGEKLVADAFALVSGGWVDYTIVNPLTLKIDAKTSYIERVTEDIVIGCGVYKNQAQ